MSASSTRTSTLLALFKVSVAAAATAVATPTFAQEFTPINVPAGPPLPPPPAALSAPAGDWEATASSPEVQLAQARLQLAEAQDQEITGATRALKDNWKQLSTSRDPDDPALHMARAQFLNRYEADLSNAIVTYRRVEQALGSIDPSASAEADRRIEAVERRMERIREQAVRQRSLNTASCLIDRESCTPPDRDMTALMDEVDTMAVRVAALGGGGVDAGPLLAKTRLLRTRAELMLELVRAEGVDLVHDMSTSRSADGRIRPLLDPSAGGATSDDWGDEPDLGSPYAP